MLPVCTEPGHTCSNGGCQKLIYYQKRHKRPERVADNVKKQKEQTRQKVKTWRNRQKTENSAKYVPLKKTDKEEKNES